MPYIEITLSGISPDQQDLLAYLLAEAGFESFTQEFGRLHAFIPEDLYSRPNLELILADHPFEYAEMRIPDQNWNEEWEKNFSPVMIAGECIVRAPFHEPAEGFRYEIIIEPKMSFGTAHHETTSQMIGLMLEMDLSGKRVLDMGCGTGILAILADKMNASGVLAIDNGEWAFNNSAENTEKNSTRHVTVKLGGVEKISGEFDAILANITRNTLLEQIPVYSGILSRRGNLLMSGFYEEDLPLIRSAAASHGLAFEKSLSKNRWVATRFVK